MQTMQSDKVNSILVLIHDMDAAGTPQFYYRTYTDVTSLLGDSDLVEVPAHNNQVWVQIHDRLHATEYKIVSVSSQAGGAWAQEFPGLFESANAAFTWDELDEVSIARMTGTGTQTGTKKFKVKVTPVQDLPGEPLVEQRQQVSSGMYPNANAPRTTNFTGPGNLEILIKWTTSNS